MHPVLFPFGNEERWLSFLSHWVTSDEYELGIARTLVRQNLLPVIHGSEIAHFIGISPKLVGHMAKRPRKYYRSFRIPKKNGKARLITAPRVFLKTVQRYILDCILQPVPVHPSACGFVREKNCADGAEAHVKRPFVWNIDLKDFFPSIHQQSVHDVFKRFGYPEKAARFLAQLCCLDGALPQGAPTSPAIANHVFASSDVELLKYAAAHKIKYTRYADDLTFSANELFTDEFRKTVISIIERNGFELNRKKERLMGPKCRREVTGLTINDQVSIPRYRRRQMRAYFHQISKSPTDFSREKQVAIGNAAWIYDYHPAEGSVYLEIAHSIPDLLSNEK
jgi:retron-type reverse transcriptase